MDSPPGEGSQGPSRDVRRLRCRRRRWRAAATGLGPRHGAAGPEHDGPGHDDADDLLFEGELDGHGPSMAGHHEGTVRTVDVTIFDP
jgi:hypothetical protein